MQFLRQQRKERKRKTYLEKIKLADKIQSAKQFNETYELQQKLKDGGQGSVYSIRRKLKPDHVHSHNDTDDEEQKQPQSPHVQTYDEEEEEEETETEGNETKQETELVVKILSLSDIDDTERELNTAVHQFELLQKSQLLSHRAMYYDEHDQDLYIVTERLYSTLSELKHSLAVYDPANNGQCNEHLLKHIICDVVHSLHVLHSQHFIHCDINPSNIMKDLHGNFKLIDFDMMMQIDTKRGYVKDCWKGTVGWAAPEIGANLESANNEYSFSTDLWSIGLCIVYLLNDFQNPFEVSKQEVADNQLNDEATKLEYYYKYKLNEETYLQVQYLLISWFVENKISWNLYDLLLNHLLVFDVADRCKSCSELVAHSWFASYIKQNKHKYRSFDSADAQHEQGEMLSY